MSQRVDYVTSHIWMSVNKVNYELLDIIKDTNHSYTLCPSVLASYEVIFSCLLVLCISKSCTFRLSVNITFCVTMGAKSTDASSDAIPAAAAPSSLDVASIKSKTVVKAFDLPVVSDTYDSLVKLTSPLSPIVEKIGSMASPAVYQVIGLKAGIEAKVPDVVSTGFTSALAQVLK